MKKSLFGCNSCSQNNSGSVHNGIQIAILILSALAVIIGAARLIYDIYSDKLCSGKTDDSEGYDFDPSDIYDDDDDCLAF